MRIQVTINNEQYLLRPWTIEDASAVALHANNRKVSWYLRDRFPYPYTLEDAKQFINMNLEKYKTEEASEYATEEQQTIDLSKYNLAIVHVNTTDQTEEAIGSIVLYAGVDEKRKTAEFGYWLSEQYWGKGVMSKLASIYLEHVVPKISNYYVKLLAIVTEGNTASCRVLERNGFELEATLKKAAFKHGKIVDQMYYARFL